MTELEGAILGVVRRSAGATGYAVRKVFLTSHSAEWSGSAGAVYPAIERLAKEGLLAADGVADKRGTRTLRLTGKGRKSHDAWLCDVERATGPGMDPFRTRADLWSELDRDERRRLMKALKAEIEARLKQLRSTGPEDPAEKASYDLHTALLELRLAWLARS